MESIVLNIVLPILILIVGYTSLMIIKPSKAEKQWERNQEIIEGLDKRIKELKRIKR